MIKKLTGVLLAAAVGAAPFSGFAQDQQCPDLKLAAISAQAFDTIAVSGLPPAMQAPVLAAVFDAGDAAGVVTYLDDTGLFVPPHPTDPFKGGPVLIEISDGETVCAPRELSIAALERSDGATRELVAQLTATLGDIAVMIDADIDEISQPGFESDDPLEMWLSVYGRWLAWDDESVLAQIDDMEGGDFAQEMALVDAAIGKGGFVGDARTVREAAGEAAALSRGNQKDKFGFVLPPAGAPARRGDAPDLRLAARGEAAALALILQAKKQPKPLVQLEGDYIGEAVAPQNAAELANMMEWQFSTEISGKPSVSIYRDGAGLVLGAGGTFLQKAGAGTAFSKVGTAYKTGADALFVMAQLEKVVAGLYPAEFVRLEIEYAPEKLELRQGRDKGMVTAIKVTPRSKGLELSKIAAEIALTKLPAGDSALKSGGRFGRWLRNVKTPVGDNVYIHADNVGKLVNVAQRSVAQNRGTAINRATGVSAVESAGKTATSTFGINNVPDVMKIMPFDYPPVDIMQTGYYELRSSNPGVVELGLAQDDDIPYSGIVEGASMLMASTAPGKFANSQITGSGLVRVGDDAELTLTPPSQTVFPGDWAAVTIIAREADNLAFDWQISPAAHAGRLQGLRTVTDSDGETISISEMIVTTAPEKALFPARLEVWLKDRPEIRASAYIESPRISPRAGCVPWGVEQQYSINLPDLTPVTIRWSVEGTGRIDEDGVYIGTGSGGSKRFTVIATDEETGEEIDRVEQTVGCTCSWTYSVGGLTDSGDIAHIRTVTENGERAYVLNLGQKSDDPGAFDSITVLGRGDPFTGNVDPFEVGCDDEGKATADVSGMVQATAGSSGTLYMAGATLKCPRRQSQQERLRDGHCPDVAGPTISMSPVGGDFVRGSLSGPSTYLATGSPTLICSAGPTFRLDFVAARPPMDTSAIEDIARQAEQDPSSIDPMALMQQMMNMGSGEDLCSPEDY